jgi:hypothetical protein
MSIAPHTGIVDFGTFTAPTASTDGIQGEVPQPLAGQEGYVLTGTGWASAGSVGLVGYQGTWNASTNTPTLTSSVGVQGYYYVVDVAGTTNLNGITDWQVGDWAIFNGSIWQKVDNTDSYDPANVAITGGTINGTTVGATTPAAGTFTTLTATGQTRLSTTSGSTSVGDTSTAGKFGVKLDTGYTLGSGWDSKTAIFGNINTASGAGSGALGFAFDTSSGATITAISPGVSWYPIRYAASVHQFSNQGVEQARVSHTASAVNYHQLTGSATGSGPIHSVAGSDTNIDINLTTKGTGNVNLNSGNGTQFRVGDTFAGGTATNFYKAQGTAGGGVVLVADGASTNIPSYLASKGISPVIFTTGGVGVEQLRVAHTASAVNYVQVTGAATGARPTLSAQGSDSSIGLTYVAKGTGSTSRHAFQTGSGTQFLVVDSGVGTVNTLQVYGSASGSAPVLSSQGSDTNIPLVLQPKGTGALQAQQTDSTATGGNARGANAVDWQTKRSAATQVASGLGSVICGGEERNTASGQQSFVGTGYNNNSSTYGATIVSGVNNSNAGLAAFIGAGSSHTIGSNGAYSVLVGGNTNTSSGRYNFIGGGTLNSGTSGSAVTSQATTAVTSGSTAVTLSASNGSIKVGQLINGTGMSENTYVAAISGTSLTLSQNATATGTPTLTFLTPHGVVVGGGNNQATGSYSFIGGGGDAGTAANRNVASGDWSFVGGGRQNTASGVASFIGGGGTVAAGAAGSTASGDLSFIGGGRQNNATGTESCIIAGVANIASGNVSTVLGGRLATTRGIIGNVVGSASESPIGGSAGNSQFGILVLGKETTNATATVLTSNGGSGSTNNQVILPNNSAYYFKGSVIANVTGAANGASWSFEGAIMRGANAASTVLIGTPAINRVAATAGATAWVIALTADTTNGGLAVTVTGAASTTIRWVCKAETTEVTF